MFIYNVTSKVDHSVVVGWLHWLKEEHIPAMINTGCFTHAVVCRLTEVDDDEGLTYAVQYHSGDKTLYNKYVREFKKQMQENVIARWSDRVISFSTLMEVVH